MAPASFDGIRTEKTGLRADIVRAMYAENGVNFEENEAVLEAILSKLEAEGLVIRPKKADQNMIDAGLAASIEYLDNSGAAHAIDVCYESMIAAHPDPLGANTDET